jgi:hypothetical protein
MIVAQFTVICCILCIDNHKFVDILAIGFDADLPAMRELGRRTRSRHEIFHQFCALLSSASIDRPYSYQKPYLTAS